MKSVLKKWFGIILLSSMASCAAQQHLPPSQRVTVPNIEFYGDKGKFGATMVESLHPEKPGVKIPKSKWDELRIAMVCTKADNVRTLQTIVDKLCAMNQMICDYAKEGVDQVKNALSSMERAAR